MAASRMRVLDHIASPDRVWVPTRRQIAQHRHAHLAHSAEGAAHIGSS